MKLTNKISLPLILFAFLFILPLLHKSLSLNMDTAPTTTPDGHANPSDAVYSRVKDYINELAEEKMKTADLMAKKKLAGSLPDGFAQETIDRALETRADLKRWRPIMSIPTEMYRICVYPNTKINYSKWCNNNYFGLKNKSDSCKYSFCNVCCDHLVYIYQSAAEKNIIGELLQLNQDQGVKAINDLVDRETIYKCKAECKKEFPIDMPVSKEKTPRDPELGSEKKPAMSCMDIKKWGARTGKSGVYWVELGAKGAHKVFCDMETDKGGWTLFFNYLHQPGQELTLNENKIPNDLKTNSHMYLENAGFTSRDVKEIRFLCTERIKVSKKYWHFKSTNKDIVRIAMKGDQTSLKSNSLPSEYTHLRAPAQIEGKYSLSVDKTQIDKFNVVGNSPIGGFSATTFGSEFLDAYWTVKGDNPTQEMYECGTSHKQTDSTGEDSPSMVFSHHSVWFKGSPPTDDEARERFINSILPTKY